MSKSVKLACSFSFKEQAPISRKRRCMKNAIRTLCLGMLLAIAVPIQAEEHKQSEGSGITSDPNVFATVNGTPLSMSLYHFLLGSREQGTMERQSYDDDFDLTMHRQQTAQDLIMTELLAQHATRQGMHETELVKVEMAMAEKTLLAQLYVQKLMDTIAIDESAIRDYYDQQSGYAMYRFMIWQTEEEDRAGEILSALKSGNDAGISDEDVIETPWLRNIDIAPEVNELVRPLEVNDFAEKPIFQDGFWKVVQLIDRQVITQQSYEEEREIIEAELVRIKLDEKLEELAGAASIRFNEQHVTSPLQ